MEGDRNAEPKLPVDSDGKSLGCCSNDTPASPHIGQRDQHYGCPCIIVFGHFAWRCIGEAMSAVETTGKVVRGGGQSHRRRNRGQLAGTRCGESASLFRARAFDRACAAGKVLGTARGDIIAEKRMTEEPAHESSSRSRLSLMSERRGSLATSLSHPRFSSARANAPTTHLLFG
jgi:hypothetical protein